MISQDFSTTVEIDRPSHDVYAAINRPRTWWSDAVHGTADSVGSQFVFDGGTRQTWHFEVTELVPGERVVWRVTDSAMSWVQDEGEWTGTEVRFELDESPDGTRLRFTHVGLTPALKCFEGCSRGWSGYLTDSLPNLVTTGRGRPGAY